MRIAGSLVDKYVVIYHCIALRSIARTGAPRRQRVGTPCVVRRRTRRFSPVGAKRSYNSADMPLEMSEAPPVADEASEFRGSAPLVATEGKQEAAGATVYGGVLQRAMQVSDLLRTALQLASFSFGEV